MQQQQQQQPASGLDDIFSGFDANAAQQNQNAGQPPVMKQEKSAFDDDGADGNLSSDIDGDAP